MPISQQEIVDYAFLVTEVTTLPDTDNTVNSPRRVYYFCFAKDEADALQLLMGLQPKSTGQKRYEIKQAHEYQPLPGRALYML